MGLGYKADPDGVCAGLCFKALEAFLCGELANYFDRMDKIDRWYKQNRLSPHEKMADTINRLVNYIEFHKKSRAKSISEANKLQSKRALSNEDEFIFDMLGTFDGIELAQNPKLYTGWVGVLTTQGDFERLSAITAPKTLQAMGGLIVSKSWPGIYTYTPNNDELTNYCHALDINAKHHKQNLAILFGSIDHLIIACYQADQETWVLFDPANFQIEYVKGDNNATKLAKIIYGAFVNEGPVAFETIVCTTADKRLAVNDFLVGVCKSDDFMSAHGIDKKTNRINIKKMGYKTYKDNLTLLTLAAKTGQADTVVQLLEDSNQVPKESLINTSTILHGDVNMMRALMKFAPRFDQETIRSFGSVLAKFGQVELFKELIQTAKLNLTEYTRSLAYVACETGQLNIIEFLYQHFKIDFTNNSYKTSNVALTTVAAMNGHAHILAYINDKVNFVQNKTQVAEVIKFAAKNGYIAVFQFLIKQNLQNFEDEDGNTPLFYALKNCKEDLVKLLVDEGKVNVNLANTKGITPGVFVAKRGDINMLELLRKLGADLSVCAPCGETPLEAAKKVKDSEHLDAWTKVIQYLTDNQQQQQKQTMSVPDTQNTSKEEMPECVQDDTSIIQELNGQAKDSTKEKMRILIKQAALSDAAKIQLYESILKRAENNPLTTLFWLKRGIFAPNLGSGTLKELQSDLEALQAKKKS